MTCRDLGNGEVQYFRCVCLCMCARVVCISVYVSLTSHSKRIFDAFVMFVQYMFTRRSRAPRMRRLSGDVDRSLAVCDACVWCEDHW